MAVAARHAGRRHPGCSRGATSSSAETNWLDVDASRTVSPPARTPSPLTVSGKLPWPPSSMSAPIAAARRAVAAWGVRAAAGRRQIEPHRWRAGRQRQGSGRPFRPSPQSISSGRARAPGATCHSSPRVVDGHAERAQSGSHQVGVTRSKGAAQRRRLVGQRRDQQRAVRDGFRAWQRDRGVERLGRGRGAPQLLRFRSSVSLGARTEPTGMTS